jgi:hypothetical protein
MPTPEELTEATPLRDAIAAHLAAATHDGRQLDPAHAVALADHLLAMGAATVESIWAGSRNRPMKVHTVRISVAEDITA